ncbi:hypothetical protein ACOSP7_022395 [Xanthoceras sorbifolium]
MSKTTENTAQSEEVTNGGNNGHVPGELQNIQTKTFATRQGSKSVTEYANLLKNLWQELDHYRCKKMKCSEDSAILKRFIEKDRVYDFFAGLNTEFDQVRVQTLGREEVPSLNETISMVRAEEGRRSVMLEIQTPVEGSAMVSNSGYNHSMKSEQSEP